MKTMTCKQLGGACDEELSAENFAEIARLSKEHGLKIYDKGDEAHLEAMSKMKEMMGDPEAINKWTEEREKEFNALPEN